MAPLSRFFRDSLSRFHDGAHGSAAKSASSRRSTPSAWRLFFKVGARRPNGPGARRTRATLGAWRPNGPDTRGAHAIRPVNTERAEMRRHGDCFSKLAREVPAPPSARGVRTGPARVRPRQVWPSRMTPRDFTSEQSRGRAATCCDRAPSTCTPLHGKFLNLSIRQRNMAFFSITSAKTAKALRTLRQNSLRALR